jgi:hypothetical protein
MLSLYNEKVGDFAGFFSLKDKNFKWRINVKQC